MIPPNTLRSHANQTAWSSPTPAFWPLAWSRKSWGFRWPSCSSSPASCRAAPAHLGILADTFNYYEQSEPVERDMMRPRLLRAFGWQVTSVLAKDWYEDQPGELRRLLDMLAVEYEVERDEKGFSPG
jgi:hypothetical protein